MRASTPCPLDRGAPAPGKGECGSGLRRRTGRHLGEPDLEFCRTLTREHGVAAIPLTPFCAEPLPARLVRFCFAKDGATLAAAAGRLARV